MERQNKLTTKLYAGINQFVALDETPLIAFHGFVDTLLCSTCAHSTFGGIEDQTMALFIDPQSKRKLVEDDSFNKKGW